MAIGRDITVNMFGYQTKCCLFSYRTSVVIAVGAALVRPSDTSLRSNVRVGLMFLSRKGGGTEARAAEPITHSTGRPRCQSSNAVGVARFAVRVCARRRHTISSLPEYSRLIVSGLSRFASDTSRAPHGLPTVRGPNITAALLLLASTGSARMSTADCLMSIVKRNSEQNSRDSPLHAVQ
jgi:hypothetical protein